MSYGIIPYRVSLGRLATRFGHPDPKKRSRIKSGAMRYAKTVDQWDSEDSPKMKEIVAELLDGKATHERYGHKYWYAIKGLVEDIGRLLNNSAWYPCSPDIFFESELFSLYDIDAPMKIPTPDDFPVVFVLRYENMDPEKIDKFTWQVEDGAARYILRDWIYGARKYKTDLVLFYH